MGVLLGCADAPANRNNEAGDTVASTSQALDRFCGNATPVATIPWGTSFTTVRTYNPPGCFKGQVIELVVGRGGGGGGGAVGPGGFGGIPSGGAFQSLQVDVEWADTVPTTQSACEALILGGYLFVDNGEEFVLDQGTADWFESARGAWDGSQCEPPKYSQVTRGSSTTRRRVAAGARTAQTTSAATRAFKVSGKIVTSP
jgi:hypothetical protein